MKRSDAMQVCKCGETMIYGNMSQRLKNCQPKEELSAQNSVSILSGIRSQLPQRGQVSVFSGIFLRLHFTHFKYRIGCLYMTGVR